MKIEVGKKYRTRDGKVAEITSISDRDAYPVAGDVGGELEVWTAQGVFLRSADESDLDLIEEVVDGQSPGALKIEVGKKYRTRNGVVVLIDREGHPEAPSCDAEFYQFSGRHETTIEGWRADGRFWEYTNSRMDLVEEVAEDAPEPAPDNGDPLLSDTLRPGGPIHYPYHRLHEGFPERGIVTDAPPVAPADIVTISTIDRAMRDLTAHETNAVIAWFGARYPASPF